MVSFSGITITKVSEDKNNYSSVFEIGPLPKGYGYTLGNSLRRVLLSSLPGAAITSVRINNLDHEFTTIPGVKQNILDIILRLKNIRVKVPGNDSTILTLSKKGLGVVKAGDFSTSSDAEIINGDYVIAELTDESATLNIEAMVEKGIGYKRADESLRDEIGRVPVDSIFSPVRLVDVKVLPSRKGARTDLDKIVLTIVTDGTVEPMDSVTQSIQILKEFYDYMGMVVSGEAVETTESSENSMMAWKLSELEISADIAAALKEHNIVTLSDAAAKSKSFYQKEAGFKPKQIKEINNLLEQYNLSFAKDEKKSKKTKS
jgi:DNA-directed RNA polymerase subunit alpha